MKEAKETLTADFGGNASDPKRSAAARARGFAKLIDLVEADKEAGLKKARDDENSRRATGRAGHLAWLANKDKTKILLPPRPFDMPIPELFPNPFKGGGRMVSMAPPSGLSFRKIPPSRPPPLPTSVEIARAMEAGLRYAHATVTGDGASRDLLASRKQLLKEGFISIQNFASVEDGTITEESRAAFEKEKETNSYLLAKTEGEKARKAKDAIAFSQWNVSKDARDLALECMQLLPCTLAFEPDELETAAKAQSAKPKADHKITETGKPHANVPLPGAPLPGEPPLKNPDVAPLLLRKPTDDERELWRAIGYACRAIDRTLLPKWIEWSQPLWSKGACYSEWIAFTPPEGATIVHKPAPSEGKHSVSGGELEAANEHWGPEPCIAALKLLKTLTDEHRRLADFRATAAAELPPVIPTFRRVPGAEELPAFLHGSEGALQRVAADLAIKDGSGISFLGGMAVGAELVLQWWVGEEEEVRPPNYDPTALGAAPEPLEKLMERLGSAADKARAKRAQAPLQQPPYVVVLECCGIVGGTRSREGDWQRVFVDPPEPLPLLTSAPGSTFVPLGVHAQGLRILPPRAGEEWAPRPSTRLRGAIRLTGLLPNTVYAYRVRAFSRAGAGPYAFGAFCTAPAPPPAPSPTFISLAPRRLFSSEGAADLAHGSFPLQPDAMTIVWERRIDMRIGLLRLLRAFWMAATATGSFANAAPRASSARSTANTTSENVPVIDDDGIPDYGDDGTEDDFTARNAGLFSVTVSGAALLRVVAGEVGLRNWLASCLTSADFWPIRAGEKNAGVLLGDAVRSALEDHVSTSSMRDVPPKMMIATCRPVSVLESLMCFSKTTVTWATLCSLFSGDAEMETPEAILLADVDAPPPPPPFDNTVPTFAKRELTETSSRNDVMAALTVRSGVGSRPSSAGSALSAARSSSATRASFNPIGGVYSDLSQRNAALRASQFVLSRAKVQGTTVGGLAGAILAPPRPGSAMPMASPIATSRGASAGPRPSTAGGSRPMSARSVAAFSDGGLGTATQTKLTLAPPAGAAALKTTYSLLMCQSDGPHGQEWSEVYVGTRALRILDKLLPGTTYALKTQAINSDGQASLFGPQVFVTTALPAPQRLRTVEKALATSVSLVWEPVSSANELSTARIMTQDAAPPPGADESAPKEAPAGADIDAIFDALLAKTKGGGATSAIKHHGDDEDEDKKKKPAPKKAAPLREGDGGFGVDLRRPWNRYDTEGKGVLPLSALRGLLADLGAYTETSLLITGAEEPNAGVISSCEGAASIGALEWRFKAAVAKLDPQATGQVKYSDFVDWWNAVDAALEKARAVNSVPGTPARGGSASTSRASSAAHKRPIMSASVVGPTLGIAGEDEELEQAVVYVLEARRSVPVTEIADAAAAVLTKGGGNTSRPGTARPSSARNVLAGSMGSTLTAGVSPAESTAEASSILNSGSMTPWAVVYMGAAPRYT